MIVMKKAMKRIMRNPKKIARVIVTAMNEEEGEDEDGDENENDDEAG
jgi:hypothetical protein